MDSTFWNRSHPFFLYELSGLPEYHEPWLWEFFRWFGELVSSIGIVEVAFFCFAAALLLIVSRSESSFSRRRVWMIAILISFAAFVARLPAFLLSYQNVDEAQTIANALTLLSDPVYFRSVDGTTNGPLVSYVLLPFAALGVPLDFCLARLLSFVFWLGSLLSFSLGLRRLLGLRSALMFGLCGAAWIACFTFPDWVHYSAEDFSVLCLSLGFLFTLRFRESGSRWPLLTAAFILGLIPLTKLQLAPLGLIVGLTLCYQCFKLRSRDLPLLVLTALGPVLVSLFLLISFSEFDTFWESYIRNNLLYTAATGRSWSAYFEGLPHFIHSNFEFWVPASSILALTIILRLWPEKDDESESDRSFLFVLGVAFIFCAAFCVVAPKNAFGHYLKILIPGILLCFATIPFRTARSMLAIGGLAVLLPFGLQRFEVSTRFYEFGYRPDERSLSYFTLSYKEALEPIAVWGWFSRLHLFTSSPMATRDAQTQRQIEAGPQQEYYRKRYLKDLSQSRPSVFIEAVGWSRFAYTDRSLQGIETFPELYEFIERNYRLGIDIAGTRVFLLKDRIQALDQKYSQSKLLRRAVRESLAKYRPQALAAFIESSKSKRSYTELFDCLKALEERKILGKDQAFEFISNGLLDVRRGLVQPRDKSASKK